MKSSCMGMAAERIRDSTDANEFFLRTPRLRFRRWRATDSALAPTLWGDPEVTRLIGGPFSAEAIEARLAREIAQQDVHGVQYWPIFLLDGDTFIGCCGLRPCPLPSLSRSADARVYELGFHLCSRCWGRGLAMEAAQAVVEHAFDAVKATRLFAGHHPDNASSARLLERLGFRYDRHELYPPTGLEHPSYVLTRTADGTGASPMMDAQLA